MSQLADSPAARALLELLPPSESPFLPHPAQVMVDVFGRMEIAEEEIQKAQQRYPAKSDLLYACFCLLGPGQVPFRGCSDEAYRHHCRELLERAATGQDPRPATQAEVMLFLSEASLLAPLIGDASHLYNRLFCEVMPDGAALIAGKGYVPPEAFSGSADELLAELQRKLRYESRVVPKIRQARLEL